MKLTIERTALLKSLNHVQSVVERRNTIPILSNVLIDCDEGVRLIATDLDIEIVETVPADVSLKGRITAPAHMLYDIVRKLPEGGQLEIEQGPDEKLLLINAGRSQFALQSLPPEDFPDLASGDMTHKFAVPAPDLKRLIEKTRFAISTEETRYYLNGIYFHQAETNGAATLRAVATDGHRLAQVELALPDGAADMPGIIVPRKTVGELHKLIEDQTDNVEIYVSSSKIRFSVGPVVLTSKLIDGTFPDYERVIPDQNDKILEVDAKSFAQAVDRVSTISSEKGRAVKLNVENERITLTVNNPDSGNAREDIVGQYQSDPIEIGFNAKYLLDITGQLEGDNAKFLLSDPSSPTIVRDDDDAQALYVLMPMRV